MSQEPWEHLISVDAILELHEEGIRRFGGDPTPIPRQGCVDGSVGAAWNAELYAGTDAAVSGLCFAGCLLYYLTRNHCFIDGNKRMVWAACLEVLRARGLTVSATDDEAVQLCESIIGGPVAEAVQVSLWLAPRLEAI